MKRSLRAEAIKLTTTRTTASIGLTLAGLTTAMIAVHMLGFPKTSLRLLAQQRSVMVDVGVNLGALFAALSGAIAMTSEFRYGTIRPTLLTEPDRRRAFVAKVITQAIIGIGIGLIAAAIAAGFGNVLLHSRGIATQLTLGDYAKYLAGTTAACALWSLIGVAIATINRKQAPVLVGLAIWILFVENLLRVGLPSIGKYTPMSLAQAISGQTINTLNNPLVAGALLAALAITISAAAQQLFTSRDIA